MYTGPDCPEDKSELLNRADLLKPTELGRASRQEDGLAEFSFHFLSASRKYSRRVL